jgi:hypothetical protein
MNLKKLARARKVASAVMIGALIAAFSYSASSLVVHHTLGFDLATASDPHFTITSGSHVYAWTACTSTPVTLVPGVTRCVKVTVKNPLSVPIKITALSMTATFTPKGSTTPTTSKCTPATTLIEPTFSYTKTSPLTVPAHTTVQVDRAIQLRYSATKTQDTCEGGTFHFRFTGSATFTDKTTTTLKATPTSATPGSTVVFTATVTGTNPTYDSKPPSGHVTFVECTSATTCTSPTPMPAGTTTPITTTPHKATFGQATYTTDLLPTGPTFVEAQFTTPTPTAFNYASSVSGIVKASIGAPCTHTLCLRFLAEPARSQTTDPIGANIDTTHTPVTPVVVEVVTSTGAVDTSFSGTVTMTKVGNPSTSILKGTTTVAFTHGLAKFSNLRINHAGSYKLKATANPTVGTTPAYSTRFNIDTELEHCTAHPCSTKGTTTAGTRQVTVTETTTSPSAGYITLGFGGAPTTFTCGAGGTIKGKYVATVDVLTTKGLSTLQTATTWTVTYTIAKTIVKTTGPTGAALWQICFASTTVFTGTGPVAHEQLTTGTGTTSYYYVGLLRTCSKTVKAPCVVSRNKTKSGREVITIKSAGDSYVRP